MASHDTPVSLLGHLYSFNTLCHSPNLIYLVEPTVENASINISSSIPRKVVLYTYSTLRLATDRPPQVILILVKTFGGAILKDWNARWSFIILDPYNKRWRFKPYKEADLPSTEEHCMPSPWWHKQHAAKEIPNPDMTFSEISLITYNNLPGTCFTLKNCKDYEVPNKNEKRTRENFLEGKQMISRQTLGLVTSKSSPTTWTFSPKVAVNLL